MNCTRNNFIFFFDVNSEALEIKPPPNFFFFFITFSCSPYTISPGITIQNCTLSRAITWLYLEKKTKIIRKL